MPTPTEGSDCVTGKRQYATKAAAAAAARGCRKKGFQTYAYRCAWCLCFHTGNRRADNSKGRTRKKSRR